MFIHKKLLPSGGSCAAETALSQCMLFLICLNSDEYAYQLVSILKWIMESESTSIISSYSSGI